MPGNPCVLVFLCSLWTCVRRREMSCSPCPAEGRGLRCAQDVRGRIAAIPQEPILFSGTIRSNVDPYDEHEDHGIWTALERVDLKARACRTWPSRFNRTDALAITSCAHTESCSLGKLVHCSWDKAREASEASPSRICGAC